MKQAFWIFFAVLVHAAILLFGKALLPSSEKKDELKVTEVDLSQAVKEKEKEPEQEKEKVAEKVEAPPQEMVDVKAFEEAPPAGPAALAPMSLSDLAGALNGAGDSFFGSSGGITSGGVIGGTGTGSLGDGSGAGGAASEQVDERPRAMGSPEIKLPPALKKAKGKVVVKVIVDENGRVTRPQVESSTNSVLNAHVIEGLAAMRFEPATRGGRKVPCKVRLPIVLG
jgi:periplasmic protein TonB